MKSGHRPPTKKEADSRRRHVGGGKFVVPPERGDHSLPFRPMSRIPRLLAFAVSFLFLAPPATTQQLCGKPVDKKWWTTPEREGWQKTSTSRDVRTFLAGLQKAHPNAFTLSNIGIM